MTANWYVLHSKPNKEDFLCDQLMSAGVESYCPHVRARAVDPRSRQSKAYFPGYVFVRLDPLATRMSAIDWLPGALGFVCFDREPADVPETLVQSIRRRVDEIKAAAAEWPARVKPGERVVIVGGPFSGYEAVFDARLSAADRVRVLLTLVQRRQIAVELAGEQIQPKTLH